MRFKILAMAVIVLALVVATAVAADVDGKWTSERQGRGGETMTTTYTFKAEGTTLTGTMSNFRGEGEDPIEDGKIEGNNISFVRKMSMGENEMTIKYSGTVEGDEIKLTMEIEGGPGGPGGGGPGGKAMEMILKRAK